MDSELPTCCFANCDGAGQARLRIRISPPPDGAPVVAWGHETCFARLSHGAVDYDDPKEHGRIPPKARCAFCGEELPVVGRHPFVFDVGDASPPQRLWAHAECMLERVVPDLGRRLTGES